LTGFGVCCAKDQSLVNDLEKSEHPDQHPASTLQLLSLIVDTDCRWPDQKLRAITALNTAESAIRGRNGSIKSRAKGFFRAYELRMDSLVTHPLFEYRVSYRRLLEIQVRLLARVIEGEIATYPVFVTR